MLVKYNTCKPFANEHSSLQEDLKAKEDELRQRLLLKMGMKSRLEARNKIREELIKEEVPDEVDDIVRCNTSTASDVGVVGTISQFLVPDFEETAAQRAEELRLRLLLKKRIGIVKDEPTEQKPKKRTNHKIKSVEVYIKEEDQEGSKKVFVASSPSEQSEVDDEFKSMTPLEERDYEDMSNEEKAQLSPALLIRKEQEYQKRLVARLPILYPGITGCRSVKEYRITRRIEEGTFGIVYEAVSEDNDEVVALKKLKLEKEREGFPITSLREINMLMKCRLHRNIIRLIEVVVGSTMDKIYLVMEFAAHDVRKLMKSMEQRGKRFTIAQVKTLLIQLLDGLNYIHSEWVIHRDLKPSNLLLTHDNILKIGDFGLSREYGDPLKCYTPVVVTLWYRSPELLLGSKLYSTKVDLWSVGCIFGEFFKFKPMFRGTSEIDQLNKIFMDTGVPNETVWPGYKDLPGVTRCVFPPAPFNQIKCKYIKDMCSEQGLDLLQRLLALCPERRICAEEARKHKFFQEQPHPASVDSFPMWPSTSDRPGNPPIHLKPI